MSNYTCHQCSTVFDPDPPPPRPGESVHGLPNQFAIEEIVVKCPGCHAAGYTYPACCYKLNVTTDPPTLVE